MNREAPVGQEAKVFFYSKSAAGSAKCPVHYELLLSGKLPDGSNWRRILSNFHPSEIEVDGRRYNSVEHGFQAAKFLSSDRPREAKEFEIFGTVGCIPLDAKRAGSRTGFKRKQARLRAAEWEEKRDEVMMRLLRARWDCDLEFRHILQVTHAQQLELVHFERSGPRSYWGAHMCRKTGRVLGKNRLGGLLMQLSSEKFQ